jgi:hypothetical protein
VICTHGLAISSASNCRRPWMRRGLGLACTGSPQGIALVRGRPRHPLPLRPRRLALLARGSLAARQVKRGSGTGMLVVRRGQMYRPLRAVPPAMGARVHVLALDPVPARCGVRLRILWRPVQMMLLLLGVGWSGSSFLALLSSTRLSPPCARDWWRLSLVSETMSHCRRPAVLSRCMSRSRRTTSRFIDIGLQISSSSAEAGEFETRW